MVTAVAYKKKRIKCLATLLDAPEGKARRKKSLCLTPFLSSSDADERKKKRKGETHTRSIFIFLTCYGIRKGFR